MKRTQRALITGATSGIGLHLAWEFAKHGHALVLVAPVEAELRQLAQDIAEAYSVEIVYIAQDLREPDAVEHIAGKLDGKRVHILVNDAGHGKRGEAWKIPLEDDLSMIRLNVEAVVRLTKEFLPGMVARKNGKILNVASVAGFEPGPNYATYAATKAFVLSYSESIASELADSEVTITALCPGPTDTDFFQKAGMEQSRAFQQANLMAPQEVAEAGYKALMAGDRVVIPGAVNKILTFSRRVLPQSAQAAMNKLLTSDAPKRTRKRGDKEHAAARSDAR